MGKSIFKGAGMNLFNIGLYLFFSNRDGKPRTTHDTPYTTHHK
jgi:hypothetical protein